MHFLGPKKGVIFTRALFTRLFYLYFWRTGGDIFGKGEKTAPRGHFSTFFPVLAGVMGLSTPILGGLKDGFSAQKLEKMAMFWPIHTIPKLTRIFDPKIVQKSRVGTRKKSEASSMIWDYFFLSARISSHDFLGLFDPKIMAWA